MDIRQLRYFLAIAEEGQISKAARRLNIAKPPLSQQLKMLEQELGVILIERGARQIRLTDAGRLLQERATKLLEFLSATTSELKDMSSGAKGSLSIGAVASAGASFLPERVRQFHQRYPDVTFQFWDCCNMELSKSESPAPSLTQTFFRPSTCRRNHCWPPNLIPWEFFRAMTPACRSVT